MGWTLLADMAEYWMVNSSWSVPLRVRVRGCRSLSCPTVSVALVEHFSALEDPRCTGKVEHRLIDILVIAVFAVIACAVRLGLPATANPLKPKPGLAPK
jgi:hypothetical protein